MKRGVDYLVLSILFSFLFLITHYNVYALTYCNTVSLADGTTIESNCCEFDSSERDLSKENCEICGHLWFNGKCCDDGGEYFCGEDGESCLDGVSYYSHCVDGVHNCDEWGTDCGGELCGGCCNPSSSDNYCPPECSVDEDIDCCNDLFNGTTTDLPWSDEARCCNTGDYWCSNAASCVSGQYFVDHCNDGIRSCGESGVDCGGECKTCSLIGDGVCSYTDLLFYQENDPDCCSLIGGTFNNGKCCYGNENWCAAGGGSCVGGVYYSNHCSDGVQNTKCIEYLGGKEVSFNTLAGEYESVVLSFYSELGTDCGGICGSCQTQNVQGEICSLTYDCLDGLYCSQQHCCPFGSVWSVGCCSSNGVCI